MSIFERSCHKRLRSDTSKQHNFDAATFLQTQKSCPRPIQTSNERRHLRPATTS